MIKLSPDGVPKCAVCGFSEDRRLLQFDHVNNDGSKDLRPCGRRRLGVSTAKKILDLPEEEARNEFQILCVAHNWIKKYNETGEHFRLEKC